MLPEDIHSPQGFLCVPEANALCLAQLKIGDQRFSDLGQADKSGVTKDHFFKKKKKAFPVFMFCEINIEKGPDITFLSWF